MEARAVAGTIPGTIDRVPADKAFEMRADRGKHRHVTSVIAIHGAFLPMQAHDFPFSIMLGKDIGTERALALLGRDLGKAVLRMLFGGIVHQTVQLTQRGDGLLHHILTE